MNLKNAFKSYVSGIHVRNGKTENHPYMSQLDGILSGSDGFDVAEKKLEELVLERKTEEKKLKKFDSKITYLNLGSLATVGPIYLGSAYYLFNVGFDPSDQTGVKIIMSGIYALAPLFGSVFVLGGPVENLINKWSAEKNSHIYRINEIDSQLSSLKKEIEPRPDIAYLVRASQYDAEIEKLILEEVGEKQELTLLYSGMDRAQDLIAKDLSKKSSKKIHISHDGSGSFTKDSVAKFMGKMASNRRGQVGVVLIDDHVATVLGIEYQPYLKMHYNPSVGKIGVWSRDYASKKHDATLSDNKYAEISSPVNGDSNKLEAPILKVTDGRRFNDFEEAEGIKPKRIRGRKVTS